MTKLFDRDEDGAQLVSHGFAWGSAIGGLIGALIAGQNFQAWDGAAIVEAVAFGAVAGGLLGHWVERSLRRDGLRRTDESIDVLDALELDD